MHQTYFAALFLLLLGGTASLAGDDPSIKGPTRSGAAEAMKEHLGHNTVGNHYIIYDAVQGDLKGLTIKKLHQGIVKKEISMSAAPALSAARAASTTWISSSAKKGMISTSSGPWPTSFTKISASTNPIR